MTGPESFAFFTAAWLCVGFLFVMAPNGKSFQLAHLDGKKLLAIVLVGPVFTNVLICA